MLERLSTNDRDRPNDGLSGLQYSINGWSIQSTKKQTRLPLTNEDNEENMLSASLPRTGLAKKMRRLLSLALRRAGPTMLPSFRCGCCLLCLGAGFTVWDQLTPLKGD